MRTRPTIDELRAVVAHFRRHADPSGASYAFYSRVADNVSALITREAELGPGFEVLERQRLTALLGEGGKLAELNRALCAAIRSGAVPINDARLLDHLRLTARENLAVDNPRYASYRRDIGDD